MRVIAGSARGVPLTAPKGKNVRPTLDRVREALFNIIGPRIPGSQFLDLFAGTGANGIEALSRDAEKAVLIENDPRRLSLIRKNLDRTRLGKRAACYKYNLPNELRRLEGRYDIVFADPPYKFTAYDKLLQVLAEENLVSDGGMVIIEHSARMGLPERVGPFERTRQNTYGDSELSFYALRHENGAESEG